MIVAIVLELSLIFAQRSGTLPREKTSLKV
jgi:hypothetical protein